MHFWMFYAILSAQKNFTPICFLPNFFLGEVRCDTMLPSISIFFFQKVTPLVFRFEE